MQHVINLIIAHGQPVFTGILKSLINSLRGFHVITTASSAEELQKIVAETKPDVIMADAGLPGINNLAELKKLANEANAKVIISWCLTDIPNIKEAIDTGFHGYITQEAIPADYKEAVRTVTQGKMYCCPETERLRGLHIKGTPADPLFFTMTSIAYRQIAYCILLNYTNDEIASIVHLTVHTVKTYKQRLKEFLGSLSTAAIQAYLRLAEEFGRSKPK